MRLELFPTGLATKDSKKKWLVYEIMRYRNFIRLANTIKLFLMAGMVGVGVSLLSGWGIIILFIGLVIFDFHYELLILWMSKDFYLDLADACFDVETISEHDFRILMNRVENFVKTKDANKKKALYKDLESCYDEMRLKTDLKEAFNDLKKGEVKEEAKA